MNLSFIIFRSIVISRKLSLLALIHRSSSKKIEEMGEKGKHLFNELQAKLTLQILLIKYSLGRYFGCLNFFFLFIF